MGLWDFLAKVSGVDKELPGIEADIASDPKTPEALLRAMAEKEPAVRAAVRANPSCPPDLAAWIDAQPD